MSGKRNIRKAAALMAAALLLAGGYTEALAAEDGVYENYLAGTAEAQEAGEREYTVIEIASEADLAELAAGCTLDVWSRDKYVKLTEDISLQDNRGLCIPSFGGIFDGAGHSISNLELEGKGSAVGLFRYIQEGGTVQNLSVEGRVVPGGSQNQTGGIVGVNYGKILNCSFAGNVSGNDEVGGIAGVNEDGGEIRKCTFSGMVLGNHSSGGVAGSNHGIISSCTNSGEINTHGEEVSYDLEDITVESLEDWNSTSNVTAHVDSGGIAGICDGKIYYCTNTGAVGYPHVGYNVGGIVGRLHQGYLQNCTNTGHIQGRKDVGGIAGQMEPFLEVQYLNDKLQELDRETDRFLDLLENFQENLDSTGNRASGLSENLTASLKNANAAGGNLLGTAGELWYVYNQELTGISGALKDLGKDLGEQGTEGDRESYRAALRRFGDSMGIHLDNITSATGDRSGGINDNLSVFNAEMEAAGNYLEELARVLGNGAEGADADADALAAQARVLRRLISGIRDDLFRYEGFTVEDISDESAAGEEKEPGTGTSGSGTEAPGTGAGTTESGPGVPGTGDSITEPGAQYDTTSFQQGKVTGCVNGGTVEADTNVGGIVGQIAIEYDLDPEDDITLTGAESFDVERTIKAVVRDSRNQGKINAKKDYAGGIVGKADYGAVISCESYGDVSSSSGSYVGGIAGGSAYAIRSCYAMGNCSGKNAVGGIAGKGCDIFCSYAYSQLVVTGEGGGAIAGRLAKEGVLAGNYYVEGGPDGVDGIGYQGGAAPLSYEELCRMDGMPDAFSRFTIIFLADGKELDSLECGFGDRIGPERIPAIPEKEGYYGVWPEFDFDCITGNRILEARYEKWVGALESGEKDENGRAKLLVEGKFLPGTRLALEPYTDNIRSEVNEEEAKTEKRNQEDGIREESGQVQKGREIIEQIGFSILCPEGGEAVSEWIRDGSYVGAVQVRLLCEDVEDIHIEVEKEGVYTDVPVSVMGSYLVFSMEQSGTFRVVRDAETKAAFIWTVAGCGAAVLLLSLLLFLFLRRRAKG